MRFIKFFQRYFLYHIKISRSVALILSVTTLLFLICTFFLSQSAAYDILIRQNLTTYLDDVYQYFQLNINEIYQQLHNYTMPFHTDNEMFAVLTDPDVPDKRKMEEVRRVSAYSGGGDLISCVSIVTSDGHRYSVSADGDACPEAELDFVSEASAYDVVLSTEILHTNRKRLLVFGTRLINYQNNNDYGYILMYVDHLALLDLYRDAIPEGSEVYLTINNIIISHTDSDALGHYFYFPDIDNGTKMDTLLPYGDSVVHIHPIRASSFPNMKMVTIFKRSFLYQTRDTYSLISVILFFANLFLSILMSLLLSRRLSKSLTRLSRKLKTTSQPLTAKSSDSELYFLEKRFSEFMRDIDTLIAENRRMDEEKRKAEQLALRAQINPHFIYNALETMSGMARVKRQPEIQKMCIALGRYFRLGLHRGDEIVPVKDELAHVESYLTVERIRFPQQFDVKFEIDEELLQHRMLKLLIQPIVENCVHHAFDQPNFMGLITIRGYLDEEDMIFEIHDNGSGLPMENPLLTPQSSTSLSGYGLKNVNQRIRLTYGAGYGLSFDSAPKQGTTVTVRIKKEI